MPSHVVGSVGQYTTLCLYRGLARARVYVFGHVCFVLRKNVAFGVIGEVIIRLSARPSGVSKSRGGATWRCTAKHARALGHERRRSATQWYNKPLSRLSNAAGQGIALCPASYHLEEDDKGRLIRCTKVGAHANEHHRLYSHIMHTHDIVTNYLARNEDACTLVGK